MRRSLPAFAVAAVLVAGLAAPVRAGGTLTVLPWSAAFRYLGATSDDGISVRLFPAGTARLRGRGTWAVGAEVHSDGQPLGVTVDGSKLPAVTLSDCGCWQTVGLASGLSSPGHSVRVRNLARDDPVWIRRWTADAGAEFVKTVVPQPSLAQTVPANGNLVFWISRTTAVEFDVLGNGATFRVVFDDRFQSPTFTIPESGVTQTATVDWGTTPGTHRVAVRNGGTPLVLQAVRLSQAAGAGTPTLLTPAAATAQPLLTVYGDSITDGQLGVGLLGDSDGYADRLASLRGMRVWNEAAGYAGAVCYGKNHLSQVTASNPDAVIVAFGVVDMAPGPDRDGCDPTLDEYASAMREILSKLQAALPDVPIY